MISVAISTVISAEELIRQYGYWMVFAGTLLQGDATVVAAGFLAHREFLNLPLVFLTAAVATILESTAYYELARWKRSDSTSAGDLLNGERIAKVLEWVRQRGTVVVLISRFLPGFRLAVALASGASRMTRLHFFAANVVGAAVWVAAMEGIGYSGGQVFENLFEDAKRHEWTAAAILTLSVGLLVVWQTRGRVMREMAAMLWNPGLGIGHPIDRLGTAINSPGRVWRLLRRRDGRHASGE